MNQQFSFRDQFLLFRSKHKLLCKLWSYIKYAKISIGIDSGVKQQIDQALDTFLTNPCGRGIKRKIILDILYSQYRDMIQPKEYFLYHFRSLSDYGRKDFVGIHRLFIFWRKLWNQNVIEIYNDKFKTYQTYKKYYKREVIEITADSSFEEFDSFVQRHNRFIVKPISNYGGKGIHIVNANNQEDAIKLFEDYKASGTTVLEELVEQVTDMAAFYPGSVNTIRIVTFYYKERLTKICAILRMGRKGSEVDNATYGGIYAPIDIEHGIVYTYAESYVGEKYAFHPDTGVQILGAKIPKWDELNSLMEELVKVVPEQYMIGWDMALTSQGWVMIEANHDPASQDLVHDHGLREVMHDFYEAFYEQI